MFVFTPDQSRGKNAQGRDGRPLGRMNFGSSRTRVTGRLCGESAQRRSSFLPVTFQLLTLGGENPLCWVFPFRRSLRYASVTASPFQMFSARGMNPSRLVLFLYLNSAPFPRRAVCSYWCIQDRAWRARSGKLVKMPSTPRAAIFLMSRGSFTVKTNTLRPRS